MKENLYGRKCWNDSVCVLCGEEPESVAHLLMNCRVVQPIWYASGLRIDMRNRCFATFQDFLWSSIEKYPTRYTSLIAYIGWEIWTQRNVVIFEENKFDFHRVLQRATDKWNEDVSSHGEAKAQPRGEDAPNWEKPPVGKLKYIYIYNYHMEVYKINH